MKGNRWGYVSPSSAGRQAEATQESGPSFFDSLLVMVVTALLLWRLLLPAEGSVRGDTLWVTLLWPLALALWGFSQWRSGQWQIRFNWLDVVVWLFVGGHVLAAVKVLATVGDKRATLNMLCEWIAVGISFFLVRQVVVDRTDRRNLTLVLASAAIAFAGLGIWQHFVMYPELSKKFDEFKLKWEQLDQMDARGAPQDPDARTAWEDDRNRILGELHRQNVPADRRARMIYEQRIKSSSEPFGTFALANTFAGLLACQLIICLGVLVEGWRRGAVRVSWCATAVLAVVVAYCLVLTKSRTAYIGLMAGLAVGGFALVRSRAANPRKVLIGGIAGLSAVLLLGIAGWASGGMDKLVLSESGKSLRYRLEYWRGTWEVLTEGPGTMILGVGPGNFRQHYLRHKLPESSEEVADPHNLLLDCWVNGGLTGLVGLLGICVAAGALVVSGLRIENSQLSPDSGQQPANIERTEEGAGSPSAQSTSSGVVVNGFVLGGVFAFLGAYVTEGAPIDSPLPALAVGWGLVVALCSKIFRETELSSGLLGAAAITLLIHLLGAGGIGMPAITQTLLVLVALGQADENLAPFRSRTTAGIPFAAMTGGAALSLGCLACAFWPVMSRENLLAEGDSALSQRRNPEEATAAYARAAAADRWSSEPPSRLAGLAYQRSQQARQLTDAESWMEKAVKEQQASIDRDPLNHHGYSVMADWCLQHGRETKSTAWLERAAGAYRQALDRYPTDVVMNADLAEACWLAHDRPAAEQAAKRALELHEINVRAGHPDKQLPANRLELLRRILKPGAVTNQQNPGKSRSDLQSEHRQSRRDALRRIDPTAGHFRIDHPKLSHSDGVKFSSISAVSNVDTRFEPGCCNANSSSSIS